MANASRSRGHRAVGKFNHTDQAARWSALAAEIVAFRAAHPTRGGGTANGGPHPGSLVSLAEAMGLENCRSTLRHMLNGTRRDDGDGSRIPGPDKIKAARIWLKKARKAAGAD
ncbi:MAG: hypothetical protein V4726_01070 [Verrucomicrobiota bacterium]